RAERGPVRPGGPFSDADGWGDLLDHRPFPVDHPARASSSRDAARGEPWWPIPERSTGSPNARGEPRAQLPQPFPNGLSRILRSPSLADQLLPRVGPDEMAFGRPNLRPGDLAGALSGVVPHPCVHRQRADPGGPRRPRSQTASAQAPGGGGDGPASLVSGGGGSDRGWRRSSSRGAT